MSSGSTEKKLTKAKMDGVISRLYQEDVKKREQRQLEIKVSHELREREVGMRLFAVPCCYVVSWCK
jgi:hypothetical protein